MNDKKNDMSWLTEKVKHMTVEEMEAMLDWEIERYDNYVDLDVVDTLVRSIIEAKGLEYHEFTDEEIEEKYKEFCEKYKKPFEADRAMSAKKTRFKRFTKFAAIAACVSVMVFSINTVSASVYSKQNFLSAVVEYFDGGIKIDFNKKDVINLSVSEDDPYGIRTKCAEYGMDVMVPTYLPEGFELIAINSNDNDVLKTLTYCYKFKNASMTISYKIYNSIYDISKFGIPSDEYNITEENINGYNIIISKEDNQFTAVFLDYNVFYTVLIDKFDYSEGYEIIKSYK